MNCWIFHLAAGDWHIADEHCARLSRLQNKRCHGVSVSRFTVKQKVLVVNMYGNLGFGLLCSGDLSLPTTFGELLFSFLSFLGSGFWTHKMNEKSRLAPKFSSSVIMAEKSCQCGNRSSFNLAPPLPSQRLFLSCPFFWLASQACHLRSDHTL